MTTLHIQLLGDFLLRLDETLITTVDTPRLQALLAYLVLHATAPQARRHLAFQLWPDSSEAQARTNLRNLLHLFRRALPEAEQFLSADGPWLQWQAGAAWTLDVANFEQLLAQAAQAGDPPAVRKALATAAALYRGALLPGCYDDWVAPERERLHQMALGALEQLLLLLEAEQDYPQAIRIAQQLLRHDPLYESTYRHLMRLHALVGDRTGALRVYQTCVTVLQRELSVEPAAETRAVYEQIGRIAAVKAPVVLPAPVQPTPPRHNLPALLTSFVGRRRELGKLTRLLARTRLLTITGAGGCGKSRLALAAATEVAVAYPDGVWWVELAALNEAALVPQAVATTLYLRDEPQRPLLATLIDALQAKTLLLVLDNCEHLIAATAQLTQALLNACPQLRMLATSREALGIGGETVWLAPSLTLPVPEMDGRGRAVHLPSLLRAEAVQLFVERAEAVLPTFVLTQNNAAAVAQICRRLDGIPLALELAAARVKLLAVTQIADRLDNCFRLLADGSRTALPRHQTLQAAIDWSFDLLSPPEQLLFARLAVFVGGWTLTAAEVVCSGGAISSDDVLALLAHLVDKSLVVVEAELDGEARYHFLETMHQYARKRLAATEMAVFCSAQHLAHFLQLAELAEPELRGSQQELWSARLEADFDNLRAAFQWALAQGADETVARFAVALLRFWDTNGHVREGQHWLEQTIRILDFELPILDFGTPPWRSLLGAPQDATSELLAEENAPSKIQNRKPKITLRAKALNGLGVILKEQSDYPRAGALYAESLALWRSVDDTRGIAMLLNNLAEMAQMQGDYTRARALYEESLVGFQRLDESWAVATVLNNLGTLLCAQGDYPQAQRYDEESLTLRRALGDSVGIGSSLINLGEVIHAQGDDLLAQRHFVEALALFRQLGHALFSAIALLDLGLVQLRQGDDRGALTCYAESLDLFREHGSQLGIANCLVGLAGVAGARRQAVDAARLLGAAEQIRTLIAAPMNVAERVDHEWIVANIQESLEPAIFTVAWAEGRSWSPQQVMVETQQLVDGWLVTTSPL